MNFDLSSFVLNSTTKCVIRIYFQSCQRAVGLNFWKRLWNNDLSYALIERAKGINIYQAIIYPVRIGYLCNNEISENTPEIMSIRHPICLELLDTVAKLEDYLLKNEKLLEETQIIFFSNVGYKINKTIQ